MSSTLQRRVTLAGMQLRLWLGSMGAVGLLLLALSAGALWWAPKMAEDTVALQEKYEIEKTNAQERRARREPDPSTRLQEFHDGFPETTQHLTDLRKIFRLAKEQNVGLPRGDYAAARKAEAGLATFDVVLPVKANYAALRAFVASVLNALPHASLVELRMEREASNQLNARVHLTLYYRES